MRNGVELLRRLVSLNLQYAPPTTSLPIMGNAGDEDNRQTHNREMHKPDSQQGMDKDQCLDRRHSKKLQARRTTIGNVDLLRLSRV